LVFAKLSVGKRGSYLRNRKQLSDIFLRKIYLLLILWLIPVYAFAQKTDIIVLHNGDHITGEVKRLEFGMLTFKTDDMGTISIKWDKIEEVYTFKQFFRVELEDGLLFFGTLDTDTTSSRLIVEFDTLRVRLNFSEIVHIDPIKRTFWDRVNLSLSTGFDFKKGSDVTTFNFNGNAKYRTYNVLHEINISSNITIPKSDSTRTERNNAGYTYNRFLAHRWFYSGSVKLEQNTELGIDLRLSGGAGFGKNILQTNSAVFAAGTGVRVNREWTKQSTGNQYNLEGLVGLRFSKFRYDNPKLNLDSEISVYPSLTTIGRVRSELDIILKWEIIKDLFWDLQYYTSYDNKPPNTDAAKIDYGIVLSLGWTF
jgi:hypothetical protein